MPPVAVYPVFVSAALALLLVPGPAVLYITTRSATQGRRAGLVSVVGIHTGTLVHIAAAVAGLSALLVTSATMFSIVRVLGAAYLIVLGAQMVVRRQASGERDDRDHGDEATTTPGRSARRLYLDGVVVNVLNPKTALFFLAFLPQFVRPDAGPVWSQTLVLGLLFVVIGAVTDSAYALAAAGLGARAARGRGPRSGRRWGRPVEGLVLIALGVATLAAGRGHRPAPSTAR